MYKRKTIEKWKHDAVKVMFAFSFAAMIPSWIVKATAVEFISPISNDPIVFETVKVVEVDTADTIDEMVGEAVDHYFTGTRASEVRMIMHCLLHRESGHAGSNRCGDSGLACGPLQFHNPTWKAYRKIMIDRGEATEIGDRHDLRMAIWTTVWAISDGRATAWGPISRDSQGNNYASCQTPSWY